MNRSIKVLGVAGVGCVALVLSCGASKDDSTGTPPATGGSGGKAGASAKGGGTSTGGSTTGGSSTGGTTSTAGSSSGTAGGSAAGRGMGRAGAFNLPAGGMGGLAAIEACADPAPVDGESCDASLTACQTDTGICACFDRGDGATWNCFDAAGEPGGAANGGFGNFGQGGRSGGGRGSFGQAGRDGSAGRDNVGQAGDGG